MSGAMINATRFVIAVHDLEASAAFYRDVLGFSVHVLDPGLWLYVNGPCEIMAGLCPGALPPRELGDHGYFGYLLVDDLDALHEQVRRLGVEVVKPLRTEPWGRRELGIRTADGHRVMLAQLVQEASTEGNFSRSP